MNGMHATKGEEKDIFEKCPEMVIAAENFCKCAKTAQTQRIAGELGRHMTSPSRSSVPNPRRILR